MPTFKICGQLHHSIGSLLPMDDSSAKFLQIYFVGNEDTEASLRCSYSETDDKVLMKELQAMLHAHNFYVRQLKCVMEREIIADQALQEVKVVIRDARIAGAHQRQTNAPSVNEIAVVISADDTTNGRDIIIEGTWEKCGFYSNFDVIPSHLYPCFNSKINLSHSDMHILENR